jgi:hypothetical protein
VIPDEIKNPERVLSTDERGLFNSFRVDGFAGRLPSVAVGNAGLND